METMSVRKPRFVGQDSSKQAFVVAVRKEVNAYFREKGISQKGDYRLALQIGTMLLAYILPYILIMTVAMPAWLAGILSIVEGAAVAGIGMCVMHGGAHGAFSNKEWVNRLFGAAMNLLGNSVFTWKIQHNLLHHTYTNIEGLDHDIATKGPIRLCQHAPLRKIHRYQHIHAFFFYGLMTFSMIIKDFTHLRTFHRQGLTAKHQINYRRELAKMIGIKLLHLTLFIAFPILFTSFLWWQVLIGFMLMHLTAGLILSVIFQLDHVVEGVDQPLPNAEGIVENDWIVHELLTTADFARNNRLLNWYIGGLNFQIEHHIFPQICHIHYRDIAPIVQRTAQEYGLPYHLKPTLFAAIRSHQRQLKHLGRA